TFRTRGGRGAVTVCHVPPSRLGAPCVGCQIVCGSPTCGDTTCLASLILVYNASTGEPVPKGACDGCSRGGADRWRSTAAGCCSARGAAALHFAGGGLAGQGRFGGACGCGRAQFRCGCRQGFSGAFCRGGRGRGDGVGRAITRKFAPVGGGSV